MTLEKLLIGKFVKVDHPITCMNPTEYFEIKYVEAKGTPMDIRVSVRGENTMWFGTGLILDWSDEP
jgi:hypothetical protein